MLETMKPPKVKLQLDKTLGTSQLLSRQGRPMNRLRCPPRSIKLPWVSFWGVRGCERSWPAARSQLPDAYFLELRVSQRSRFRDSVDGAVDGLWLFHCRAAAGEKGLDCRSELHLPEEGLSSVWQLLHHKEVLELPSICVRRCDDDTS